MSQQKQTQNPPNVTNTAEQFAFKFSMLNLLLIAIVLILFKIIVFYLAYLYGMHQSDKELKEKADQKLLKAKAEEIRSGYSMRTKKKKMK
jgi:predicted membrane protein